jgi:hypothetical protein
VLQDPSAQVEVIEDRLDDDLLRQLVARQPALAQVGEGAGGRPLKLLSWAIDPTDDQQGGKPG